MEANDDDFVNDFLIEGTSVWTLVDRERYPAADVKETLCRQWFSADLIVCAIFTDDDLADRYVLASEATGGRSAKAEIDIQDELLELLEFCKGLGVTHVFIDPTFGERPVRRYQSIENFIASVQGWKMEDEAERDFFE